MKNVTFWSVFQNLVTYDDNYMYSVMHALFSVSLLHGLHLVPVHCISVHASRKTHKAEGIPNNLY